MKVKFLIPRGEAQPLTKNVKLGEHLPTAFFLLRVNGPKRYVCVAPNPKTICYVCSEETWRRVKLMLKFFTNGSVWHPSFSR